MHYVRPGSLVTTQQLLGPLRAALQEVAHTASLFGNLTEVVAMTEGGQAWTP